MSERVVANQFVPIRDPHTGETIYRLRTADDSPLGVDSRDAELASLRAELAEAKAAEKAKHATLRKVAHALGACHCWDFGCEPADEATIVARTEEMRRDESERQDVEMLVDERDALRTEVERLKEECSFVGRAAGAELKPICEALGVACEFGDEPGDLGADVAKAIERLKARPVGVPVDVREAIALLVGPVHLHTFTARKTVMRWLYSLPEMATSERERVLRDVAIGLEWERVMSECSDGSMADIWYSWMRDKAIGAIGGAE